MNYRNDKHSNPISILGYGCMRFTKKGSYHYESRSERVNHYGKRKSTKDKRDETARFGRNKLLHGEL